MSWGFIGLGQMGLPMALNLSKVVDVLAFDRDPAARSRFTAAGGRSAETLDDLCACQTLVLCVPNAAVATEILFGPKGSATDQGLADRLPAGATVVDTSTAEYAATCDLASRLAALGLVFIDAPVSGMEARAREGTLTMMCGGAAEAVDRLRPSLSAMASTILHMGPTGSGQLAKLVNQLLFDINAAALAEILPMAAMLGLDPAQIGAVVNSGSGRSFASEFFVPRILEGNFADGYSLDNAYKDLVSGAEIAARHRIPAPVLAAATATYQQALRQGHGDKDKGAMILVYEALLGVRFRRRD